MSCHRLPYCRFALRAHGSGRASEEAVCGIGDYDATTVRLVREAGFTCAATTRFGLNDGRTSPWELRRGGPWEYDLPTFALKLATYRLTE
jgi:hypothetical protein